MKGKNDKHKLEINKSEARIVKRIFEECLSRKICKANCKSTSRR